MQNTVAYHVTALHKNFLKYTETMLKDQGLHKGQLSFLLYIGKHPGCSPTELKHALQLDWGYCQRAITKLVTDGFVLKGHEPGADYYTLTLTSQGNEAFQCCHQVFMQWDDITLSPLRDSEREQLITLLDRLTLTLMKR